MQILRQILILVILTMINAFFAGAEMAVVSVNKSKIGLLAEKGNKKAILILKLLKEPTKFLSTIQVAITLSSFFASASAATGISKSLAVVLTAMKIPYAEKISFVLITVILSYFTLVFGELVPKRVALQKAELFSMAAIRPVILVSKIAAPFIKLLTFSTNVVLKIFGMKSEKLEEEISKEEIKALLDQGIEQGVINKIEQDMINSVFEFDNKVAREIMTPRIQAFTLDISMPMDDFYDELFKVNYSRIPVYEDNIDNIIGILYVKDLLKNARETGFDQFDIRSILRKPYLVPESKDIDELFKEMQYRKTYFAILINEYGEFSGIVTIEDLVEEIVGEIEDEYVKSGPGFRKIDETTYLIDGLMMIDEINSKLNLQIESDNYDTISGFLIDRIGTIPENDDKRKLAIGDLVFELVSVKDKHIDKLKLYLPENPEDPELTELKR